MKIKSVRASRIPGRIMVYFDDRSYLPLSVDDIYHLHLKSGLEVNRQFHAAITYASFTYLLKNYALNQIALSARLKRDLTLKLRQKYKYYSQKYGCSLVDSDTAISALLDRLEAGGLLDETVYVQSVINRLSRKPLRFIQNYLRSRGVDPGKYRPLFPHSDLSLLKTLLASKKYRTLKTADFKTRQKLIASLLRKGFAYNDIKSSIDITPLD